MIQSGTNIGQQNRPVLLMEDGSRMPIFPTRSLSREVGEEVVELLLLRVLGGLEFLDVLLILLDLGLLLVELLEITLVGRCCRGHLLEVGAEPDLILNDGLQLPLLLADLALSLVQSPAQLHGMFQPSLDLVGGDRLLLEE